MPWPPGPRPVVIDANLALYALNPFAAEREPVLALFARWRAARRALLAPCLWPLEVASGLRKMASVGMLRPAEAQMLLEVFLTWEVRVLETDDETLRRAYAWAERLGQRVLYDSLYLALAEVQAADFWTADRRLYRRAREAGASFVYLAEVGQGSGS